VQRAKKREKAFADIAKLPTAHHEAELIKLAARLGEDLAALRDEFAEHIDSDDATATPPTWDVVPWPDAVATAPLLRDVIDKIKLHFAARLHELLAIALWVLMTWTHDIAATHSPFLAAVSAEPDSGKTTLLGTVSFLVPRPIAGVESTAASIFRFIDHEKPTLLLDEADDLFKRKADVRHILNASWTRNTKIARQQRIGGNWVTVWFDIFCPKVLGALGKNLPHTLATRSIIVKMWPKKPGDPQSFDNVDDDVFAELRSKLARWSADNAAALKDAKPLMPAGFGNRVAANWKLLFAVAELAGGPWPARAREAAERLARTARKPSLGLQLLAALQKLLVDRTEITSEDVVARLRSDPDSLWVDYRGKGPVTQRQVADLLEQYDIVPHSLHPTKRKDFARRGYRREQFTDVFSRYLPSDPIIRSSRRQSSSRRKKKVSG
jgi:putative DNA primase/helicase